MAERREVFPKATLWTWRLIAERGTPELIDQASVDWAPQLATAAEALYQGLRDVEPLLSLLRYRAQNTIPWGTTGLPEQAEVDAAIATARRLLDGQPVAFGNVGRLEVQP